MPLSSLQFYSFVFIFILLRMRTLRHREVKSLAKGHTAGGRAGVQNQGDLAACGLRLPACPTVTEVVLFAHQALTKCLGGLWEGLDEWARGVVVCLCGHSSPQGWAVGGASFHFRSKSVMIEPTMPKTRQSVLLVQRVLTSLPEPLHQEGA